MFEDDESKAPTRVTKFDVFALVVETIKDLLISLAESLSVASQMLQTHANFVEEKQNFHEYAARTIETLQEGE
jgi:hypothetical protein